MNHGNFWFISPSNHGVPAKRSKNDSLAPFSEAKLGGKLIKNLVFAVPPIIILRKVCAGEGCHSRASRVRK